MADVTLLFADARSVDVPALWLRDNCPCDECRISATSEHRFNIATQPVELRPFSVTADGASVHVDWGDHRSSYTCAWYDRMIAEANRRAPAQQPWPEAFAVARFDHEAVLADREIELACLDQFLLHGAVIVTGTSTEPGSVEPFIYRWSPPMEMPFARIHDVRVDPAGYNTAHTAEALGPHNDFASKRYRPSGQILHMLVNDADDGETILVDGFSVVAQLDSDDVDVLTRVPVGFRQFSCEAETWSRSAVLQNDEQGEVVSVRYSNQLMQALDPTDPDTGPWYAAYQRLSALLLERDNQVHFRLNGGDLLMVHNHRILHGRTAFQPGTGVRHLQDIYFDYDNVANEAYRLRYLAV